MRYSTLAVGICLLWSGAVMAQDHMVGPCTPDQIRATHHPENPAGPLYIEVTLTNISDATCMLAGAPRIVSVDSGGKEVPVDVRWPFDRGDIEKGRESVALNPQGQAVFVIATTDKAGLGDTVCSDALRIYLPGSPGGRPVAGIVAQTCRAIEVSGYRIVN
jgi:hypothetical protein